MPGALRPQSAILSIRCAADGSKVSLPWERATTEALSSAGPWRTFRWHDGQRHYSGTYWSATERGHVIYESRPELARLLFANFDASVNRIFAQPFLLRAQVNGAVCRHVPDFLLLPDAGPTVVDVKPRLRLTKPRVSFTLAWTRERSRDAAGDTGSGASRRRRNCPTCVFLRVSGVTGCSTAGCWMSCARPGPAGVARRSVDAAPGGARHGSRTRLARAALR